jgi:tRNA threonylcarbamoyladenosine dehydratase
MMTADFSRNMGLLSEEQQAILRRCRITVCGVGGMGGVAVESLVRMGVGSVVIVDHDRYQATDVNRQLHCTQHVIGLLKVNVIREHLRAINPCVEVITFDGLHEGNAAQVAGMSDLLINSMDCIRASILLEREARRQAKTIVDAWLTPYASVFVMTPDSPHWEDFLGFPTVGKSLRDITASDIEVCLRREIAFTFRQFHPYRIISPQLVEQVILGMCPRPSLLPVAWISGVLMANESMKLLTGQGRVATHWGTFYNQYDHEIRYIHRNWTAGEHADCGAAPL